MTEIDFVKACREGECICKGYPKKEQKVELLKGGVTVEQCKMACSKKISCAGFEYWSNTNATNCFECGHTPGQTTTNALVRFKVPLSKTSLASVYQKNFENITNRYIA